MASPAFKEILIQHQPEQLVTIVVPFLKTKEHTCGWLLQEAKRKLQKAFPSENFENMVAFQTLKGEYAVDHWLTHPNKSLSVIKDGTILKPFYKQEVNPFEKVSLESFIIETKLGYGAFSNVYLVRKKDTGALYALKQIRKDEVGSRKRKVVLRERQAMIDITSNNIVKLHFSFQTENHVYFVLDFVPCGDLHSILKKRRLRENEVLYFVGEAILALNAIHSQQYIYRDLKPENLLLDFDGHILLTDFGLAKKVPRIDALNYSQCGTLQVMAPEILGESGYCCLVDYYNIGTLTYELATGKVPIFTQKHRLFLEENNPAFAKLSEDLKDFIKKLLIPEPSRRLGAISGLREITAHPWMASIDLQKLFLKKVAPPLLVDPSSISYQPKSSVSESIDATNQKYSNTDSRYIPNFSYDESLECCLISKLDLNDECSKEKISKTTTISTNAGSTTNSPSMGKKVSASDPKEKQEENVTEADDTEIEDDLVAAKFDHYKSLKTKSMKLLKGPPLILKS